MKALLNISILLSVLGFLVGHSFHSPLEHENNHQEDCIVCHVGKIQDLDSQGSAEAELEADRLAHFENIYFYELPYSRSFIFTRLARAPPV